MAINKTTKLLAFGAAATLGSTAANAADKDLLDVLLQNGILNQSQYETLVKKAEEKEATEKAAMSQQVPESLDWATRVKIGGDMRFRHENIDIEDARGVRESRQRIRARIKVGAQINDEVKAGFRLVTAGGRTSTNQTLEGGFGGKNIFFDRAFINYSPNFAKGLSTILGKFEQPWYNVSSAGLIWDSDVNPEGAALKYNRALGPVNLTATGGYFILDDGDTVKGSADNNSFSDDLNMYHAGLSASMEFTDMVSGTIGSNAFIYNNEADLAAYNDGDTPLEIYEVAGQINIDTGLLPVYVYGQYAVNAAAQDDEQDTAWLAGFGTKYGPFKMDYNYRDTQENAVADSFNDSDFAVGRDSARGHKVKLAYKINNNFSIGGAYFAAEQYNNENVDTFQLDLKAKF